MIIVAWVLFDTILACNGRSDRQTDKWSDGQTETIITSTALFTGSYADSL